jgi:hypothetical protein
MLRALRPITQWGSEVPDERDFDRYPRRPMLKLTTRMTCSAFISVIVVILIVLGVILYGLSKTITDAVNTTTSAPHTTGEASRAP